MVNFVFYYLKSLYFFIKPIRGRGNIIEKHGGLNMACYCIKGNNNRVVFGKNVKINKILIKILGNNNTLFVGDNVNITNKDKDYFLIDGNNCSIIIGANTSIQSAHINAQEDNSSIHIGEECMISDGVTIRTSDSHPIYNTDGNRINPAKSILIGKHVWLSQKCTILKGVSIGDGSVIGMSSIVTKNVPSCCLVVGIPARVIKRDINWSKFF